jgi:hypothetical protein
MGGTMTGFALGMGSAIVIAMIVAVVIGRDVLKDLTKR